MINIRNISIKNKLVIMQVFTSALVLGVCITAFVIIDLKGFKDRKAKSGVAIAQVIGYNSFSALEFMDNTAAEKILSELAVQNDISNAVIFDQDNNIFASYTNDGANAKFKFTPPKINDSKFEFVDGKLFVYSAIRKGKDIMGMVCIRFELSEINKIKMDILKLGVILIVIGMLLAFVIATMIKAYISKPMSRLVTSLQGIKETGNYNIRMEVDGKDEINILKMGLNDMLETIEKRDNELAKSKEELSKQKTLLESVLENMGDGLIVVDENKKFIMWNNASERIIGIGPTDTPAEKWSETYGFMVADTKTIFETDNFPLVRSLKGEELDDIEIFIQNYKQKDGIYVTATSRPLKEENGEVTGGVLVIHDITERKNAEYEIKKLNEDLENKVKERTTQLAEAIETLQKSEEKYREIVENTSDVLHTTDHKGIFTYINPACQKLTGYTREELIGENVYELVAPEWRDRVTEFYLNQFKQNIPETLFSFPIITKSREQKWIEQTVTQLKEGNTVTGYKSIMRDITERKEAEQKIKESEGQLQTLFNQAPDALIVINDEGNVIRWNPQSEKTFGWSSLEVIGKPIRNLIIPDNYRETFDSGFENFLKTGESEILNKTFESTAINKKGIEFDIELTVSKATIKDKYVLIGFIKDISERKRLENEKREIDRQVRLNELKLKLILENIGEGIVVTDTQKRVVLSNHMAEEIIGIKQDPENPITLDWSAKYDIYYPDQKTIFPVQNLPLEKALRGETTQGVEVIIADAETQDKKRVIISGRPIIDENNYIIAAVANIKDVTYYKELENALEESEEKIRNLIGFKKK